MIAKPNPRILIISATIGAIVAIRTAHNPIEALLIGLITLILWYGLITLITRTRGRACAIGALIVGLLTLALFATLALYTYLPPTPDPTPHIIIITATPSPVP